MQIRTASLTGHYEYIYEFDDALDHDAPDFADRYKRALETSDWSALPRKPGQDPVIWKLKHLRGRAYSRLLDLHRRAGTADQNSVEALYEAAALALVEAHEIRDEAGKIWEPQFRTEHGIEKLTEQSLTELATIDKGLLVICLGRYAISKCFVDPT